MLCLVCNAEYDNRLFFITHLKHHEILKEIVFPFSCCFSDCKFKVFSIPEFRDHLRKEHEGKKRTDRDIIVSNSDSNQVSELLDTNNDYVSTKNLNYFNCGFQTKDNILQILFRRKAAV